MLATSAATTKQPRRRTLRLCRPTGVQQALAILGAAQISANQVYRIACRRSSICSPDREPPWPPPGWGMHHMSLRQGFRSFLAKRRRTFSRETLSCSVSLTNSPAKSSSVHRERPCGGLEQAVATSRASSLPESLRPAPGRGSSLSAASKFPSTKRRLVR